MTFVRVFVSSQPMTFDPSFQWMNVPMSPSTTAVIMRSAKTSPAVSRANANLGFLEMASTAQVLECERII